MHWVSIPSNSYGDRRMPGVTDDVGLNVFGCRADILLGTRLFPPSQFLYPSAALGQCLANEL